MNPTDQARKEARRRELKKNKKQRILVRNAVLKGKNPREIIEEMEKIDDMEFNPITPCPLNQKVMAEKRRKLKETWDRVISMYEKDAPEQWEDLKKLWLNYQGRKIEVVKYYESVLAAKDVHIDAIPLPNMSMSGEGSWDDSDIPLPPPSVVAPPKAILKKPASVLEPTRPRICPGVPAAPPPPIQDYEDLAVPGARKRTIRFGQEDDEEAEQEQEEQHHQHEQLEDEEQDQEEEEEEMRGFGQRRREERTELPPLQQPNPLQRKMLEMAGQDLDQFMKEMEEVHRQREAEKAASLQQRLARLEAEPGPPGIDHRAAADAASGPLRPGVPPPGVRLPPGPPPGRPQGVPGMPQQLALPPRPGVAPPGVRPPPGPPPGVPPSLAGPPGVPPAVRPNMPKPLGVLSAKPQLNKQEIKTDKVIESAPVMRNLKSDVTRFVPTHLRVKRDEHKKDGAKRKEEPGAMYAKPKVQPAQPQLTKDDAYKQFMEEMKDLL